MFESKKEKVLRGWHRWFAWFPVRVGHSQSFVWLQTVERQFYAVLGPGRVAKKGQREQALQDEPVVLDFRVSYRRVGSDFEKRIYQNPTTGSFWVDPQEVVGSGVLDRHLDAFETVRPPEEKQESARKRVLVSYKRRQTPESGWSYGYTVEDSVIDVLQRWQDHNAQYVLIFATEFEGALPQALDLFDVSAFEASQAS